MHAHETVIQFERAGTILRRREVARRVVLADVDDLRTTINALDHTAQYLAVAHLDELVDTIVQHVSDTAAPLHARRQLTA